MGCNNPELPLFPQRRARVLRCYPCRFGFVIRIFCEGTEMEELAGDVSDS